MGIFAGRPKKVQYGKKECSIDTQLVVQAQSTHDTSVSYRDCARFGRSLLALVCGVGPRTTASVARKKLAADGRSTATDMLHYCIRLAAEESAIDRQFRCAWPHCADCSAHCFHVFAQSWLCLRCCGCYHDCRWLSRGPDLVPSPRRPGVEPRQESADQGYRQRLGRFVRKTLSFSKSLVMYAIALRLFLHRYNLEIAILRG
jgi:hypothetical protein